MIYAPRKPVGLSSKVSLTAKTASLEMYTKANAAGDRTVQVADTANSILHSARKKVLALKKVTAKHAAHRQQTLDGFTLDAKASAQLAGKKAGDSPRAALASAMKGGKGKAAAPQSSLLKRMPQYVNKAKTKLAKVENLEEGIAQHKFTTRGLVAAVEKAQKKQQAELSDDLRDQTDDLIIAKINQLRSKKSANTQQYVLQNSLSGVEKKALAARKAGRASPSAPGGAAAAPRARGRIQRQNQGIVHATGGSKGGDPEGMLSSYDQEILKGGPDAAAQLSAAPARAQALSQLPAGAYARAPSYAPQSEPELYGYGYAPPPGGPYYAAQPAPYVAPYAPAAPYAAPYWGAPPQAEGYAQPQLYGAVPEYGAAPQYGAYAQPQEPMMYAQPQYAQPQYAQPAYAQQGYAQPAYAQPGYALPGQYPRMQLAQEPGEPVQEPAPQPAPAAESAAAGSSFGGYGESSALAARANGGGAGAGGGGSLWKIFSSGSGASAPPGMPGMPGAAAPQGLAQSGSGLIMGGSAPSGGMGGGATAGAKSVPMMDPDAVLPKGGKALTPQAKAAVAARMQALRESIMDDFHDTQKIGDDAGYLPPPP